LSTLKEDEENKIIIIKDANKKIRVLEKTNEDLYKSRKPNNIKLPDDITTLDPRPYLLQLKDKYNEKIKLTNEKRDNNNKEIVLLKEKEKEINNNNETILVLEKTLIKLPESLIKLSENTNEYERKYKKAVHKWLAFIVQKTSDAPPSLLDTSLLDTLLTTTEYNTYETKAKHYFLSKEIETYKTNSNEEEIIKQQHTLTTLNRSLKMDLKQLLVLDTQQKELEQKIIMYNNKLEQIENDSLNLDENNKINEDLTTNKSKRNKYEKRISDNEEIVENIRKTQMLINNYEKIQREKHSIDSELKHIEAIFTKFDTYKDQIETNNTIEKEINVLKTELLEFEEVLEEIEKQYSIELTNSTKNTALLEQIKKDITEYKLIENNLKLYEIYKKAMKQLPYSLLNKIQPLLEKKVNDLLSIMTDFTVKFDISDNKIDIYIDRPIYNNNKNKYNHMSKNNNNNNNNNNNRYILINNGSGFERFISSLAIRIALLDISNLPKINFLAIDEGFSAFDTHNINNVGLILDYLKTKFDFILTISHLTQIKENSDIIIGLQKDENGYTKIIQ